jgi:hypothetical protein
MEMSYEREQDARQLFLLAKGGRDRMPAGGSDASVACNQMEKRAGDMALGLQITPWLFLKCFQRKRKAGQLPLLTGTTGQEGL